MPDFGRKVNPLDEKVLFNHLKNQVNKVIYGKNDVVKQQFLWFDFLYSHSIVAGGLENSFCETLNFFAFKIIESLETVDYALKIGVIDKLPREADAVEDIRGEGVVGLRHVSVGVVVRDEA